MIEGGWDYVWPAYAITVAALAVIAVVVAVRAMRWSKRAKSLEQDKRA